MSVQVYTDGSLSSILGHGSWGYVLIEDDAVVETGAGVLVADTPSNAEYIAVIKGLCAAKSGGHQEVEVYSDCTGVVNHLSGQSPVNSDRARPLYWKAVRVLATFDRAVVLHVSRNHPLIRRADHLGRLAAARLTGGKDIALMSEDPCSSEPCQAEALYG